MITLETITLEQLVAICSTLPPCIASRFLRDCTLRGV